MPDRTIIGVLLAVITMVAMAAVIPEPRKVAPGATGGGTPASSSSGDRVEAELERYRSMMAAGDPFANPGYLNVDRGETLWTQPSGQKNADLTMCDLGKGTGVVDGAYAELPRYFADPAQARAVMATWPAYRVSQNALRTMQHRLYDCFWQMRLPQVDYASDVTIALTTYLAVKGAGAPIQAPSIKR